MGTKKFKEFDILSGIVSPFDLYCDGKRIRKVNYAFLLSLIIYCVTVTVALLTSCVAGDEGNFNDSEKRVVFFS